MYYPKTLDEYIDLVHQAIYEIEDFRACVEDSDLEDDWERYLPLLDKIDSGLRSLHDDLVRGACPLPSGADLAFMPLISRLGPEIPFKSLLEAVNQVYRDGL